MKFTKPIVIGNWKMHPESLKKAEKLFGDVMRRVARLRTPCTVGVAAPSVYLETLTKRARGKRIMVGAQNVHASPWGAFTGEVSMPMLKDIGAAFVIVGHSERRAMGETSEHVGQKLAAVLKSGAYAVLCVGEQARDEEGVFLEFVGEQIASALEAIPERHISRLIIAYEPVWAIGTGENATPQDAREMRLFIQKLLSHMMGEKRAMRVPVLYGGSVNEDNITAFAEEADVDGYLVGGASLDAEQFTSVIKGAL